MAEAKITEEPTFLSKRKSDISFDEKQDNTKKLQKSEDLENNSVSDEINEKKEKTEAVDHSYSVSEVMKDGEEADFEAETDDDDDEDEFESEDEDEDDDDDDEDENSNGKVEEDRKGKGILIEDKGKGKVISEDDDDNSEDDSGDGLSQWGSDSDLSDDPLAEVDLDNILPTRTRRRATQHGVSIATQNGNIGGCESKGSNP